MRSLTEFSSSHMLSGTCGNFTVGSLGSLNKELTYAYICFVFDNNCILSINHVRGSVPDH